MCYYSKYETHHTSLFDGYKHHTWGKGPRSERILGTKYFVGGTLGPLCNEVLVFVSRVADVVTHAGRSSCLRCPALSRASLVPPSCLVARSCASQYHMRLTNDTVTFLTRRWMPNPKVSAPRKADGSNGGREENPKCRAWARCMLPQPRRC